jgi:phosphatidylethanolamine/phosphatidyl-N-methylethanolamine N-methyltransferase
MANPHNDNDPSQRTRRVANAFSWQAGLYDAQEWFWERTLYAAWRQRLFGQLGAGRVLEIGVGTGKNLPYHPPQSAIVGIDFAAGMLRQAARRNQQASPLLLADAQQMPFAAHAFDAVIGTFVFSSIPHPRRALAEVERVLRPGGMLYLIENQASHLAFVRGFQRMVTTVTRPFTTVDLARKTLKTIQRSGLTLTHTQRLEVSGIFIEIHAQK